MPIFTVGAAGTTSDEGFNVAGSAMLETNADFYRTPSSEGNRKKFTISCWIKLHRAATATQNIINAQVDGSNYAVLRYENYNFEWIAYAGSQVAYLRTTGLFKDTNAWYHIVIASDTDQGTAANRTKMYINGSQVTDFQTENYPSSAAEYKWNDDVVHSIGAFRYSSTVNNFLHAYIAEVINIDGQQLTPTSFGEFDTDSGIWKPKKIEGLTFGSQGFYLDFATRVTDPIDASGNGNNFTSSNVIADDYALDVPTNNFCTLNPLSVGPRNNGQDSSGDLSFGNTKCSFNGSGDDFGSTMAVSTGKWYWEVRLTVAQNHGSGFVDVEHFTDGDYDASNSGIVNANGFVGSAEYSTGSQYILNGTATSSAATYADDDIVGYAFDVDAGEMKIYQNGTLRDTITGIPTGVTYMPIIGDDSSTDAQFECNFGGVSAYTISSGNTDGKYGNFEYAPPAGYYALCTKRLAEFG